MASECTGFSATTLLLACTVSCVMSVILTRAAHLGEPLHWLTRLAAKGAEVRSSPGSATIAPRSHASDTVIHPSPYIAGALPSVPVTRSIPVNSNGARISLVGAGPGSPDLLTVAAYHALASADVVICDRIAPSALRAIARPAALFLVADKLPGRADVAQAELNAWGIDALQRGRNVVRLKAGDPYLYGRGGEEFEFYAGHGFLPDVIPGVCSALSAPLSAGIPVTHRGCASQVLISTGHGRDGALPELPPFHASRTLVLLMAVSRMRTLREQLGEGGYPSSTPVAVIERATHPDERVTCTTLARLCEDAATAASPAVIVVGAVVDALPSARAAVAAARRDHAAVAHGDGVILADA